MKYYDLTNSQNMIWIGQLMNPNSPQYNMAFSFEFAEEIDFTRFNTAVRRLINSTDVLRSTFQLLDGTPKMVIAEKMEFDLELLEMSRKEWESWKQRESARPFNLEESVFDTKLIKLRSGKFIWYINQHHLVTDGWALALLFNKLAKLYLSNEDFAGENIDFQPFDVEEGSLTRKQDYWKDVQEKEQIPADLNQKTNDNLSPDSIRVKTSLSNTFTQELKDLLSSTNLRLWSMDLSLFTFFSTVLLVTINKLTHSKTIAIGAPALNRVNVKQKGTIGLFIEMFPIQASISSGETYERLYKKLSLSGNNFLRYSGSGASSPELVKRFNVVLNYINASFEDFTGFRCKSEWIHPGASDPGHHVRLQVTDFDKTGSIHLYFDMNNVIFNDSEKSRFIETFNIELERFKANPGSLINPNEEEELSLIEGFNETDVDFPQDVTYLDLFREVVQRFPDQIAVSYEGNTLSFEDLDKKSNQLANYLLTKGVGKEDTIGVLQDRSLNLMLTLLGINKAGAAYVPIDVSFPKDRIDYIQSDAGIEITIGEDFDWDLISEASELAPNVEVKPEDLIYIIYTSGSTGRPKGVMNQHSGVFNRLYWAKEEFKLSASDSLLQKTNYTFDVSVGELFLPLISGCRLVLARRGGHRDSDYLKDIIEQENITSIHFVPPMLEIFLLSLEEGDCPSLRYVLCSGEALKAEHVNAFRKIFPEVQLYNLYGPTEAAIEVSKWIAPIGRGVSAVTIGKMLPNVKFRIVDREENLCPFVVPGELWIGGIQVARGYKNRDELTKNRFLLRDGIRWYRTGDLCQWLQNGEVQYLGRIDNQVKVRGYRVELGEVEHALKEHEEVSDAVVLVKNQGIVAFVVSSNEIDLLNFLKDKLPSYMLPGQISFIDKVPYLNNGKIDRQALLQVKEEQRTIRPPGNEFEEFVLKIWTDILGRSEIDIFDDFFSIGGDSLSGIRVITSINAELDLEFPVVLIFQKTTISALAQQIEHEIDKRLEEA